MVVDGVACTCDGGEMKRSRSAITLRCSSSSSSSLLSSSCTLKDGVEEMPTLWMLPGAGNEVAASLSVVFSSLLSVVMPGMPPFSHLSI